ncbi:MAG: hypothetical protein ACKOQ3_00980 [Novosphingobium sp.]
MDWMKLTPHEKIALVGAIVDSLKDDLFRHEDPEPLDLHVRQSPKHWSPEQRYLSSLAEEELRWIKLRDNYVDPNLLSTASWSMLLDLYVHYVSGRQISVTSACIASGVPPTTAVRWVDLLTEAGLIESANNPRDQRVRWLRLTQNALDKIERYLIDKGKANSPIFSQIFHVAASRKTTKLESVIR